MTKEELVEAGFSHEQAEVIVSLENFYCWKNGVIYDEREDLSVRYRMLGPSEYISFPNLAKLSERHLGLGFGYTSLDGELFVEVFKFN